MVLSLLHTAFENRHILFMEQSSLQAKQAAEAGYAWVQCQLSPNQGLEQNPFGPDHPLQGELTLANGASCQLDSAYRQIKKDEGFRYCVICTGSYRGATHTLIIIPPLQEADP